MITKSEDIFEILEWLFKRMTDKEILELRFFLNCNTPFELIVRYQDEEVKERLRKEVGKRWNNSDTKFTMEKKVNLNLEEAIAKNSIVERFGPYRKPTEVTIPKYQKIQEKALEFALMIDELCPHSQQKSSALTLLEQCKMSANAAIAIYS